jgi:hypothetical protein
MSGWRKRQIKGYEMTQQLEAMKQALEALEQLQGGCTDSNDGTVEAITVWCPEVIDALRQAIDQDTSAYQRGYMDGIAKGLRMEQAEKQEPVAWRNAALRVGEDLCSVGPFGYYDMTAEQWLDWALSVVTVHAPSPQRQPLTDEQIKQIELSLRQYNSRDTYDLSLNDFARAIEAACTKGEA